MKIYFVYFILFSKLYFSSTLKIIIRSTVNPFLIISNSLVKALIQIDFDFLLDVNNVSNSSEWPLFMVPVLLPCPWNAYWNITCYQLVSAKYFYICFIEGIFECCIYSCIAYTPVQCALLFFGWQKRKELSDV